MTKQSESPPGWDEARVEHVLEHHEDQSDEAAVAEDEAAREAPGETLMEIPVELVPTVRRHIASTGAAPNKRINTDAAAPCRSCASALCDTEVSACHCLKRHSEHRNALSA